MNRRAFLKQTIWTAAGIPLFCRGALASELVAESHGDSSAAPEKLLTASWLGRWQDAIIRESRNRYCDRELGEEIGWLVSPFLNGFYYGYLATRDPQWIERLAAWADAWIIRSAKEPDGFVGWPKAGSGGAGENQMLTDSLLGEAMGFRPIVLMAKEILSTPVLKQEHGWRADRWLELAAQMFAKWESRGCWREVGEGGLWVVPNFGIDPLTGGWTEGYSRRMTDGFSNPANKENAIAQWMLAMYDATGEAVYRDRAEGWFRIMKSRLRTRAGGKYFVWDYWDPAGPWDYKPNGSLKLWVGVHPNGGYYAADVDGIVAGYEHGLVFTRDDMERLIATNRDFMWNQQLKGAKFQRIDGGEPDARWKNTPGVLWSALIPYDGTLREIFAENHDPASWAAWH